MPSEEVKKEVQLRINEQKKIETGQSVMTYRNKYGYQINIHHPLIKPLFARYKAKEGLSPRWPISDEHRFNFESYILALIEKYEGDYEEALTQHVNRNGGSENGDNIV